MIRALVFDFDGLILDTEGPDFAIWRELFADHGCELELNAWAHCIGTKAGVFNPVNHLEELLGQVVDRESLRVNHRQRFYGLLEGQGPMPGVEDYLNEAHRLGLRAAVASSATRDWVVCHLMRFDLLSKFDVIRCYEEGLHPKPEPDLFLAAVRELGVAPEEAVAFEDSPNGVRAAKRAGLHCVAVPNVVTRHLCLDEADLRIDSLGHMPLQELLVRLNGRSATTRAQV